MNLDKYQNKRNFSVSPEPKGNISEDIKRNRIFVIQEHHATHLHYDLRLEIGGVLKSWAVPKGPPEEFNVRRLAIPTEDHPIEYANFEGEIPEGSYGAGKVTIWDRGTFLLEEDKDDKLVFQLKGKRLIGKYAMIKIMLRGKESWLLFKVMEF